MGSVAPNFTCLDATAVQCSHSTLTHLTGDQCPNCKGKCLVAEKKTFEVHVEQGMKAGAKITLRGEAGCSEPGLAPGDVILVVAPKDHPTFKRVSNVDLIVQRKISLVDALCGVQFNVKHLDGRVLVVKTPVGECGMRERGEGGAWSA